MSSLSSKLSRLDEIFIKSSKHTIGKDSEDPERTENILLQITLKKIKVQFDNERENFRNG